MTDRWSEIQVILHKWRWLIVAVVGFVIWVQYLMPLQEERKNTVCPSYLSIARSPRDTLIIMHNDSQCAEYVLEHL